jgi:glucose/arabinose dehydrogenase
MHIRKKDVTLLLLLTSVLTITIVFSTPTGKREVFEHIAPPYPVEEGDTGTLQTTTIIKNLSVPWDIAWGPDNWLWVTEQDGIINRIHPITGEKKIILRLHDVYRKRLGLLSMVHYPEWDKHPYVFLNYLHGKDSAVRSNVVRYTYRNDSLVNRLTLLDIPGHAGHNGARMAIGNDGFLMISTSDITEDKKAQDPASPNGKILRIGIDGKIPSDNPIPGNPLWALGFRVPQGLTYGVHGQLYSSEHGDATDDEVNLIQKGGNYGFPYVTGPCNEEKEKKFCSDSAVIEPLAAWTPTIAPSGMTYYTGEAIPGWHNSLLLVTLKTQSLRVLQLTKDGTAVRSEKIYYEGVFGRLRDVCVSPKGDVYISTSNRDWNPGEGFPLPGDDRIIRISERKTPLASVAQPSTATKQEPVARGESLYSSYCASCHKKSGVGVTGEFPPLQGPIITNKNRLVELVLNGRSGPLTVLNKRYNGQMPSFKFLKDEEVAEILTFIRIRFGNTGRPVKREDVAKIRREQKLQ